MSGPPYDLVVALPVFLDVTLTGLDALPAAGEERYARALHLSPGGGAIVATGAARLGLSAAIAWPVGVDVIGEHLRTLLEEDGIAWHGPDAPGTAVTVVMPVDGERAMATYAPPLVDATAAGAGLQGRALVTDAHLVEGLPRIAEDLYVLVGDQSSRRGELPAGVGGARAFIANEAEARALTGEADAGTAARCLAGQVAVAVVTRGPRGAVAASGDLLVEAPGVDVRVSDTTGAGDLFASAFVWADQRGLPLEDRVRWASLYAALSVRVPTARAGAVRLEELEQAAAELGLAPPPQPLR